MVLLSTKRVVESRLRKLYEVRATKGSLTVTARV